MERKRGRPLGSLHDEKTRLKIQTTQLVKRLADHILNDVDMKSTQIRAAEILLNKTLPNLQAMTVKAEINKTESELTDNELSDIATASSNGAIKEKASKAQVH